MMFKKIVLTTDAHHAKIYSIKGLKITSLIKEFSAPSRQIWNNNTSRDNFYHKASTQSHFLDPRTKLKEALENDFATQISKELKLLCHRLPYDALIVFAEPKLMGKLRKHVNRQHIKVKIFWKSQNLCHQNEHEIEKHLLNLSHHKN